MASIDDRRREFRRLHQTDCFVLPNPWDLGSARLLASLGVRPTVEAKAPNQSTRKSR